MKYYKKFFGHLKTVIVHRWYVFYFCCKFGMPIRGLLHDLSKFCPKEFLESVKYYTGTRSPIDACKEDKGFSLAWQHHKAHNLHHYEHWTDNYDNGTTSICMPYKYTVEMVCDYLGAGKAYNKGKYSYEDAYNWWMTHKERRKAMNIVQKAFVTYVLTQLMETGKVPKKKILRAVYDNLKQTIS